MMNKIKKLTGVHDLSLLSMLTVFTITLSFMGAILAHNTYQRLIADVTIHTNNLVAQHYANVRCVDRGPNYVEVHMERGDVKVYSTDQVMRIQYNDQSIVAKPCE